MQARVRHANRAGLHSARPASWHSMRAKVPLVVSSTPGNAVAQAPPNLAFETEAIKAQFTRWNSALATLDPKNVAALYAPDGVLLPTVSNQVGCLTA